MQQQFAVEVYGPNQPSWLGIPSDEDSDTTAPLTTDPVMAARYPHMTAASAACATAAATWPALAFTVSPIEQLYECDSCGHTSVLADLTASKHLHQRLEFPVGHPDCIMPAGDCPECGAFAYPKAATNGNSLLCEACE